MHPLVNQIVGVYLSVRPSGGRFFIDAEGAFYHEKGMPLLRFASFNLTKRRVRTRSPINAPTRREYSGAEALAMILGAQPVIQQLKRAPAHTLDDCLRYLIRD